MLHTLKPREQSGRDTFARYKAQARSAAVASLAILSGKEIDRIYCDLHDDFVIRKNKEGAISYVFTQVKTKGKQNYNWTINDLFGFSSKIKDPDKVDTEKIKDSYLGKLLVHTLAFGKLCDAVCFQTNIHNADEVDELHKDIVKGSFESRPTRVLVEKFNEIFQPEIGFELPAHEIKERLSKITFETDVQYLKAGNENFEPLARDAIYRFSEVDLEHSESKEILIKLLDLVEKKSCAAISELTVESIEMAAGISVVDLLSVLSISQDAYRILLDGGDPKAIKSASIIQRTLTRAGAGIQEVTYCSRCKTDWDLWVRNNRHLIPEFHLQTIFSRITALLNTHTQAGNAVVLSRLEKPIRGLVENLLADGLLFDLSLDLVLGGVIAELVRRNS